MVGVAVNVTEVPAQTDAEGLAATATDGVTNGFTDIVTDADAAVAGLAQAALDVRVQVTTSPLLNVEEVNVARLVPAFAPFTCH